MVMAVSAFATLFSDLGLSSAAIQRKNVSDAQQSNLFWINVLLGTSLTFIVFALAPLLSKFYGQTEVKPVAQVVSINFLINSLSAQHGAMLVRSMQFSKKYIAGIAGAAIGFCATIVLAIYDFSYWSIVFGNIAGGIVSTILLMHFSPLKIQLPTRHIGVKNFLSFGVDVTGFNIANYFSRNLDNVLIGRYEGAVSLGLYSRAYQLLMFPIMCIRMPVETVAFPVMSKLEPNSFEFRRYYCSVVRIVALTSMPLVCWLILTADELVNILLGENWREVSTIFSALAIAGVIQPAASLRGLLMLSSGQSRRYFKSGLLTAVCTSLAFTIGIRWGVMGLVWAYVVVEWVLAYAMNIYASKNTSVKKVDFFRETYDCVLAMLAVLGFCVLIGEMGYTPSSPMRSIIVNGLMTSSCSLVFVLLVPKNRILFVSIISTLMSGDWRQASST